MHTLGLEGLNLSVLLEETAPVRIAHPDSVPRKTDQAINRETPASKLQSQLSRKFHLLIFSWLDRGSRSAALCTSKYFRSLNKESLIGASDTISKLATLCDENFSALHPDDLALLTAIGPTIPSLFINRLRPGPNTTIPLSVCQEIATLFPRLETLKLHGNEINNSCLAALRPLQNTLRSLEIFTGVNSISDTGIAELSTFPNLRNFFLHCSFPGVTGKAIQSLTKLQKLTVHFLGHKAPYDFINSVQALPSLTEFATSTENMSKEAVVSLSQLTRLQSLNIHITPDENRSHAYVAIGKLRNLVTLTLQLYNQTCEMHENFDHLSQLTNLKKLTLNLAGWHGLLLNDLERLLPMLTSMEELTIFNFPGVDESGLLKVLAQCKPLKRLTMVRIAMEGEHFHELSALPHLQSVSLILVNGMTEKALKGLRQCNSLTSVELYGCPFGAYNHAAACHELESIKTEGKLKVSIFNSPVDVKGAFVRMMWTTHPTLVKN